MLQIQWHIKEKTAKKPLILKWFDSIYILKTHTICMPIYIEKILRRFTKILSDYLWVVVIGVIFIF